MITRDNVSVKVSAVLYFRVVDPSRAVVEIQNYLFATLQLAQTTLRSVGGQTELDELLAQREKLNTRIQEIVDAQTEPWGIKVVLVELKNIDLPQDMQRAIAAQAEAERERRAKVIAAEGEFQAAQKLADAADIMGRSPISVQLRYLQTLKEIAAEHNSTTLFPIPIDIWKPSWICAAAQSAPPPSRSNPAGRLQRPRRNGVATRDGDNCRAPTPRASATPRSGESVLFVPSGALGKGRAAQRIVKSLAARCCACVH